MIAWGFFVGALWVWFGWLSVHDLSHLPFKGFSVARLSLLLLIVLAAIDDTRRFRFPFIKALTLFFGWLFVTDLISGGGSWSAVVTLVVGLAYTVAGGSSERPGFLAAPHRRPPHRRQPPLLVARRRLAVGADRASSHSSTSGWRTARSARAGPCSGRSACSAASSHFANEWASGGSSASFGPLGGFGFQFRGWVPPLVYAFTGFLLVALGLVVARRRPA